MSANTISDQAPQVDAQPRQPQQAFHETNRLAKRHPEQDFHGQASLDRSVAEYP